MKNLCWSTALITVVLLLGSTAPASGQITWKTSYQQANSPPTHGGMAAIHVPLSKRSGVLSIHLRGEASYSRETTAYGGWNARRVNHAGSVGTGAAVTTTLWIVRGYAGLTGGMRRFSDTIEYVERSTDGPSGSLTGNDQLNSYEEGLHPYLAGTAGLLLELLPAVAPFAEYREWEVFGWTGQTPRNPFRSVHVGLSIHLF